VVPIQKKKMENCILKTELLTHDKTYETVLKFCFPGCDVTIVSHDMHVKNTRCVLKNERMTNEKIVKSLAFAFNI
jgi:hypothetical protein